jgi:hypothetical protein
MFYELRQYTITPGKMDKWVSLMEEAIIPFQVAQGMVITGSFREEDDTTYIWMRRFESEAEREHLYEAVYKSNTWKEDIAPRIRGLIATDGVKVQRIVPTLKSVTQ